MSILDLMLSYTVRSCALHQFSKTSQCPLHLLLCSLRSRMTERSQIPKLVRDHLVHPTRHLHGHISVMMSLVYSQKCGLQSGWDRTWCCASVDVVLKCCYSCQDSLSLCWEWHPTDLPSPAKLSALEGSQNSHKWDSAFLLRWVCALFLCVRSVVVCRRVNGEFRFVTYIVDYHSK